MNNKDLTLIFLSVVLICYFVSRCMSGKNNLKNKQVEGFDELESLYLSDRCVDAQVHANELDKIVAIECDKQKRHPYYDNEINDRRLCRLYEDKQIYQNINVGSWCSNLANKPIHPHNTDPPIPYQGPEVINDERGHPRSANSQSYEALNNFRTLGISDKPMDLIKAHEFAKLHKYPTTYDGRNRCSVFP